MLRSCSLWFQDYVQMHFILNKSQIFYLIFSCRSWFLWFNCANGRAVSSSRMIQPPPATVPARHSIPLPYPELAKTKYHQKTKQNTGMGQESPRQQCWPPSLARQASGEAAPGLRGRMLPGTHAVSTLPSPNFKADDGALGCETASAHWAQLES